MSSRRRTALAIVACVLVLGVVWRRERSRLRSPRAAGTPALAEATVDLARLQGTDWIERYDPAKAWNGYTLDLYQRRTPILFDMNGRVVHAWPNVRATARVRLLRDGHLLAICLDNVVREFDWDGQETWSFRNDPPADFPHHDLIRLRSGNTLLLFRHVGSGTDYLREVDAAGRVVWEWRSAPFLETLADRGPSGDPTHMNAVQELPENRWFDAGDRRFAPGNILVSVRNLNRLIVVDKARREVVWQQREKLDYQHGAFMVGKGLPHEGHILTFDNRHHHRGRRSRIAQIDPSTGELVRDLTPEYLFSPTGGNVVPLGNGNLLVTSSDGGRVFELDPGGAIVWQYVPPVNPMNPERYAYDFAHPFRSLSRPREQRVTPRVSTGWVDRALFEFSAVARSEPVVVGGKNRFVPAARRNPLCSRLVVPPAGRLRVGYGLRAPDDGGQGRPVTFRVSLHSTDQAELTLLRHELKPAEARWQHQTIDLSSHAYKLAELCLHADDGSPAAKIPATAFWAMPSIQSGLDDSVPPSTPMPVVSDEERANMEERLKAMGYVE